MKSIAVVLGNRINNDGSFTNAMVNRLELARDLNNKMDVEYFVLSGGIANKNLDISEASAMKDYLINKGFPKEKILLEDKSMSTEQNAIFTCKLLENFDFDTLIIVSTYEHFKTWNAIGFFNDAIMKNELIRKKDIHVMIYTLPMEYQE